MNYQNYGKPMNQQTLNTIRLVIILSITLTFGVVLHRRTFGQPAPNKNLAVAARIETYAPDNQKQTDNAKADPEAPNSPVNQTNDNKRQNTEKQTVQEGDAPLASDKQQVMTQPADANKSHDNPAGLSARSFIVTDRNAGRIIYQKNIDEKLPMASITKLMTAVIASENLDPRTRVKITKNAVNEEGASGNLKPGEEFALSDLMKIMLIVSSNDAAAAIEEYFAGFNIDLVALMNQKAERLGMDNTRFTNTTGLDQPDHFSSAHDLAKLASYILNKNNDVLDIITRKQATVQSLDKKTTHSLLSTNQLLLNDAPEMMGGKTGYTKNASGCMLSVLKSGDIIVVLGSQDRFGDTEKLIKIINE